MNRIAQPQRHFDHDPTRRGVIERSAVAGRTVGQIQSNIVGERERCFASWEEGVEQQEV